MLYLFAAPGFGGAPLLHSPQETSLCGPSLFPPRIPLHLHSTLRVFDSFNELLIFKFNIKRHSQYTIAMQDGT